MTNEQITTIIEPIILQAIKANKLLFYDLALPSVKTKQARQARREIIYAGANQGVSFRSIAKILNMSEMMVGMEYWRAVP